MTQVQQTTAQIATAVQNACSDVNAAAGVAAPLSFVPQIGAVLSYATAACGTADAITALISKAVNDPGTVTWAEALAAQLQTAVKVFKGL